MTRGSSRSFKPALKKPKGVKKDAAKKPGQPGRFYNPVSLDKHYGINTDLKKSV